MIFQLRNLDHTTLSELPDDCRGCGWWQGHDDGWPDPASESGWIETAEDTFGSWGKLAVADDHLLGMIQYGPVSFFPRINSFTSSPANGDSILLSCSMVGDETLETVRKSLLLASITELQELGVGLVEAFCYQEPDADLPGHLFDRDFLRNCGFYSARTSGGMQLMRLELGGAQPARPARQKARHRILERIKRPSAAPSPATLCHRQDGGKPDPRTCS